MKRNTLKLTCATDGKTGYCQVVINYAAADNWRIDAVARSIGMLNQTLPRDCGMRVVILNDKGQEQVVKHTKE